jgi:cholesterol transport system auxiliary component
MRIGRFAALLTLALCLAACGGAPATTFDLIQSEGGGKTLSLRRQLAVAEPSALQSLDSDKVLVRRPDGSLATLAHAQWSDRLPRLLQSRIIQAFENAGAAGRVGPVGGAVSADVTLETEIHLFEVDAGAGQAKIELAARLVGASSGKIGAAHTFHAEMAGATEGGAAARTLDSALSQLLSELTHWTAGHM